MDLNIKRKCSPSQLPHSKRAQWFEIPVSNSPEIVKENQKNVLELKPFASFPCVSFDKVEVGTTKIGILFVKNPLDVPQTVQIDKFPFDKGFNILVDQICVPPLQEQAVEIAWKPEKTYSCLETIFFKKSYGAKTQVYLHGVAISPKKEQLDPKMKQAVLQKQNATKDIWEEENDEEQQALVQAERMQQYQIQEKLEFKQGIIHPFMKASYDPNALLRAIDICNILERKEFQDPSSTAKNLNKPADQFPFIGLVPPPMPPSMIGFQMPPMPLFRASAKVTTMSSPGGNMSINRTNNVPDYGAANTRYGDTWNSSPLPGSHFGPHTTTLSGSSHYITNENPKVQAFCKNLTSELVVALEELKINKAAEETLHIKDCKKYLIKKGSIIVNTIFDLGINNYEIEPAEKEKIICLIKDSLPTVINAIKMYCTNPTENMPITQLQVMSSLEFLKNNFFDDIMEIEIKKKLEEFLTEKKNFFFAWCERDEFDDEFIDEDYNNEMLEYIEEAGGSKVPQNHSWWETYRTKFL